MKAVKDKVTVFLITGYLGSGKTTFLKELIRQYSSDLNIAVVQNEFAPANVDGSEIKRGHPNINVLEINNGSVFCVCRLSDFISQSADFIDRHQPDVLLIEASGLSDPIAVKQILGFEPLAAKARLYGIWTVVDVSNFLTLSKVNQRVLHQVSVADEVIINKCDLDSSKIYAVKQKVRSLNDQAGIHEATYCRSIPVSLMQDAQGPTPGTDLDRFIHESARPEINVAVF